MSSELKNVEIAEIKKILPNRYPYLLIDKAKSIIPGERAEAYKNLTANEWYFSAHFPQEPLMPSMLQMEALLQTLSLAILTMDENKGKRIQCCFADKMRFKERIVPGSRMEIAAELVSWQNGRGYGIAKGMISEKEVCSGEFMVEVEHEDE